MPRVALTIAGFDPSSGAGVTADLSVFAAHEIFGTACITALTVQSTRGVFATHPTAPAVMRQTLDELEADLPPAGIKIGMLATREIVQTVAQYLSQVQKSRAIPVVLDPVLVSSSGHPLLEPPAVEALRHDLLPLVTCVTPNRAELAALVGRTLENSRGAMEQAARELQTGTEPRIAVVVTGGDAQPPDDLLLTSGGNSHWLRGERVVTRSTHGTGCAFSSALLAALLKQNDMLTAAQYAKRYVTGAMRFAPGLGTGRGPLSHLWQGKHGA